MTKSFDEPALKGLHRFDVAQGFQPQKVRIHARTESAVIDQASRDGVAAVEVWRSGDQPEWQGPPAVWASWGR